jgi:hypothetical protein
LFHIYGTPLKAWFNVPSELLLSHKFKPDFSEAKRTQQPTIVVYRRSSLSIDNLENVALQLERLVIRAAVGKGWQSVLEAATSLQESPALLIDHSLEV